MGCELRRVGEGGVPGLMVYCSGVMRCFIITSERFSGRTYFMKPDSLKPTHLVRPGRSTTSPLYFPPLPTDLYETLIGAAVVPGTSETVGGTWTYRSGFGFAFTCALFKIWSSDSCSVSALGMTVSNAPYLKSSPSIVSSDSSGRISNSAASSKDTGLGLPSSGQMLLKRLDLPTLTAPKNHTPPWRFEISSFSLPMSQPVRLDTA